MGVLFEEYAWAREEATFLVGSGDGAVWWTFAGELANRTLAMGLQNACGVEAEAGNLTVRAGAMLTVERLRELQAADSLHGPVWAPPDSAVACLDGLKFRTCLPNALLPTLYAGRFSTPALARAVLARPVCIARQSRSAGGEAGVV